MPFGCFCLDVNLLSRFPGTNEVFCFFAIPRFPAFILRNCDVRFANAAGAASGPAANPRRHQVPVQVRGGLLPAPGRPHRAFSYAPGRGASCQPERHRWAVRGIAPQDKEHSRPSQASVCRHFAKVRLVVWLAGGNTKRFFLGYILEWFKIDIFFIYKFF